MSKNIYKKRTISPPASSRCAANTSKSPSTVTLSAAKGLSRWTARCFAEFTLSVANVLSMTGLDLSVDVKLSSAFEPCLNFINGHWAALAPHNPTKLNFYPQHTYIINETSRGDPRVTLWRCNHPAAARYLW